MDAIHSRLLTAWSFAGVLGPVIVNAIADGRIAAIVDGPARSTPSFVVMIVLLVVVFVCNELIRVPGPPAETAAAARSSETENAR